MWQLVPDSTTGSTPILLPPYRMAGDNRFDQFDQRCCGAIDSGTNRTFVPGENSGFVANHLQTSRVDERIEQPHIVIVSDVM